MDLKALEDAGFVKALTAEEWELHNNKRAAHFGDASVVALSYLLERGNVRISVEQNTQTQAPFGVQMVVHYPEIAIIEDSTTGRRVTCDASDTDLILALADEVLKS